MRGARPPVGTRGVLTRPSEARRSSTLVNAIDFPARNRVPSILIFSPDLAGETKDVFSSTLTPALVGCTDRMAIVPTMSIRVATAPPCSVP